MSATGRGAAAEARTGWSQQTRLRGRSPQTRLRLIRAAERLFAHHDIDGVSLRQICAAAGQRNTNAVRYHFGDKERLIEAIFEHRQSEMEPVRAAMLARVPPEGPEPDPPETIDALLAIVIRPPLMIADPEDRYNYVKLLASYLNRHRDSGLRHPLDYAPALLPSLIAAHQRLFRACGLPRAIFDLRIQMVAGLALQAVIQRRARLAAGLACPPEDVVTDEAMVIAGAAMKAPVANR